MKTALKAAAIMVLGGMTVIALAQPQKPTGVIIQIDEADERNSMLIVLFHEVGSLKRYAVACEPAVDDINCKAVVQGAKYTMTRMSDGDQDGYVEKTPLHWGINLSTGKSIRMTPGNSVYFIIKGYAVGRVCPPAPTPSCSSSNLKLGLQSVTNCQCQLIYQ